ncbi:Uncharacterised protein [uncultured archaeon]|nr:Uncharacterised protein [uncultured archaeon]
MEECSPLELVEYISQNLPAEKLADLISGHNNGREFRITSDNFIVSTYNQDKFSRIIRDIRLTAYNQVRGEMNICRYICRYEIFNDEDLNMTIRLISK